MFRQFSLMISAPCRFFHSRRCRSRSLNRSSNLYSKPQINNNNRNLYSKPQLNLKRSHSPKPRLPPIFSNNPSSSNHRTRNSSNRNRNSSNSNRRTRNSSRCSSSLSSSFCYWRLTKNLRVTTPSLQIYIRTPRSICYRSSEFFFLRGLDLRRKLMFLYSLIFLLKPLGFCFEIDPKILILYRVLNFLYYFMY